MLLQHRAVFDVPEIEEILKAETFSQFSRNLNRLADRQDPDFYDPLEYKGDVFELFAEFFFKYFNGDPILTYTSDYEPNNEYDKGIDGRGVCVLDGKPNVVQVKYKSDPRAWLTNKENISNVAADATLNEGLIPNGKNVIVFTSCQGVHMKHAMANVHCISRKEISRRVDGIVTFWNDFRSVVKETLEEAYGKER